MSVVPFHFIWIFYAFGTMVGLVVLTVWIVYVATRPHTNPPSPGISSPGPAPMPPGPFPGTPLDILARRFASGEITAEEYQQARKLLLEDPRS